MKTKEALVCGYITDEALAEAKTTGEARRLLLAAMAIAHHDSAWSDARRDLLRGTTEILGRPCFADRGEGGGA